MKRITIKRIIKLNPCYSEEQLEKVFEKNSLKRSATLDQIISANHNIVDKIWLFIRLLPVREQHLFACWCAERALKHKRKAGHEPDKRSWDAVRAKRKWLDGKITDKELKIAYDAASASDATHAAIHAATHAAAAYAYDAASAYAYFTAYFTAYAAERKKQLNRLVRVIKKSSS